MAVRTPSAAIAAMALLALVVPELAGCGAANRPLNSRAELAARTDADRAGNPRSHRADGAREAAQGADSDETGAAEDGDEGDDESSDDETEGGNVDDAFDSEPPPDAVVAPPHPLAGVADAEIERRLSTRPASLGPMSVGKPSGGMLFNAVQMPEGDGWTIVAPGSAWATDETVNYLTTAIHAVTSAFPDTQKLAIGDISARNGGYLSPHLSHQAGRDVDISYYYLDGARWYRRATAENLDVARTWAFVRALVTRTDVELLLIDHSIQKLLRTEAERIGENAGWLDTLFRGNGRLPPIIRHAPGHATHLHIRFYSPIAQETGRRAYAALLRHHLIHVGPAYVVHVAKKGDTLAKIAKKYHTTVRVLRQANGLKSTVIQAKKAYRIPQPGHTPPSIPAGPVAIPPRRLPPANRGVASN